VTTPNATAKPPRRRSSYRPPIGIPTPRSRDWGVPVSLLVHAVVVLLLITPILGTPKLDIMPQGAGGGGPAGGGGGGMRGAGGAQELRERLQFVRAIAPPAPDLPTPVHPVPPKPVEVHHTAPVVKPVEHVPEPVAPPPTPTVKVTAEPPPAAAQVALAPGANAGAGTGNDGSTGTGPGRGGGVGTGVGTGRGSAEGPGTGGGEGTIYPATPDFLVMPALPVPKRVQGKTIELRFSIDEHGRIIKVEFESSGDAGYDKQLRARLSEYRFRPAHKMDGTPVPSVYVTQLTL
jgi:protein TonB